ncbi:MAG TPA: hypothetical protein VKA89_07095 [Solirubrobacterales bacterium]|nr:hypothetical protein [Solirubrobacterales bacterium]
MLARLRPLAPLAAVAAVGVLLWLIFPFGFPNYDTIYMLVWGGEIADGVSPDLGAPLAPTPHPLAELFGAVTDPLGDGAVSATMVVAYATLGSVAYLVYRLGALWFDRAIGIVAALIVLTRAPFLSNGLRAYIDLPFIALSLAALVIETRRPRAGWPVLALLALAGLLRPEAWLFSLAYLVYLLITETGWAAPWIARLAPGRGKTALFEGRRQTRPPSHWFGLVGLAAAGPLLWAVFDWATASDPLYSFTGTRDTVETLERETGPVDVVLYGPRRLGEVLQWPGMVGAAAGLALCLAFLRRRAVIGTAAAVLALAAFAILGSAGLAVIPRYTMLAAAILAVFAAAGLLGWRLVEPEHPWRRPWQAVAAALAVLFVVWIPNQADLLDTVYEDLDAQARVEDDLEALVDAGAFDRSCLPISVPNHRAVPRLAFGLELRPTDVVSVAETDQPRRGQFLEPASDFAIEHFLLDPNDPARLEVTVPPGFDRVTGNDSWIVYRRCG